MINYKKLSICADDFGITNKVSDAIINLVSLKRITETSCMVLPNSFQNKAKALMYYKNTINIGLHLTLTDFKPLSKSGSLSDNQKMPSINKLIIKCLLKNISKRELTNEINLQLDQFEDTFKFQPKFIDGHHHVQQLPIIRDCLIEIINNRYSKNLPWVRNADEKFLKIMKRNISILKSISIGFFGKEIKKLTKNNSIKSNDGFSGIYNFSKNSDYEKLFRKFTDDIEDNHLLMIHPGHNDIDLSKLDSVTYSRDLEYNFFSSENFINILKEKKIVLKPLFS